MRINAAKLSEFSSLSLRASFSSAGFQQPKYTFKQYTYMIWSALIWRVKKKTNSCHIETHDLRGEKKLTRKWLNLNLYLEPCFSVLLFSNYPSSVDTPLALMGCGVRRPVPWPVRLLWGSLMFVHFIWFLFHK